MKKEVTSAVDFLSNLLRVARVKPEQVEVFRSKLVVLLCDHYQDHWHPDKPFRGSGYRCLRLNHGLDPLITKAGDACGIAEQKLENLFPKELTLWIDPLEVSYRIGENGSIGILYSSTANEGNQKSQIQSQQTQEPSSIGKEWHPGYTCKEQYMNGFPAMVRENMVGLKNMAAFVHG